MAFVLPLSSSYIYAKKMPLGQTSQSLSAWLMHPPYPCPLLSHCASDYVDEQGRNELPLPAKSIFMAQTVHSNHIDFLSQERIEWGVYTYSVEMATWRNEVITSLSTETQCETKAKK